ncbi:MAG TPA: hypothetical protein VE863_20280 [Pyrinomonadaceae bacterium]|jgi:hypothetical protein|nr:hypothetical protein [Pyrinomonadaceae bacterium]
MKRTPLVLACIFLAATLAYSQEQCRTRVFVINYAWDNPQAQVLSRLSNEQLNWWLKEGKKDFKNICITTDPKVADYIFSWTEKWQDVKTEITVPKTTVSQQSGTVNGTSVGTGGVVTTTGTYHGTTTTTTNENIPYQYSVEYVGGYLYKIETVEGKRHVSETPVFLSQHKGQMRWSKPEKDVFVDALKHIKKETK